jgi:hypothetical protein
VVVEAEDGTLVASALGWLDGSIGSDCWNRVGVGPGHARCGLGAPVGLACLHAMRDGDAALAKVCPRGDDAYPVPRGFSDGARTATYARK